MKFFTELSFSYVDIVVLAALTFGVFQGRKRGLSGELLNVLKWIAIVGVGGITYLPVAQYVRGYFPSLTPLAGNITVYVGLGLILALLFGAIQRSLGERLSGSDAFGAAEFYFGMMAGVVRVACVLVAAMSLINAREYSRVEVQAREKAQEENFGSIRFFRWYSVQSDVFEGSLTGRAVKTYLAPLLISPVSPGGSQPNKSKSKRDGGKRFNEVLDP